MVTSKQKNCLSGELKLFGNVRVMVISAMLIAMSIVLGKFLAVNIGQNIRISFENLPLLMAGIFFGPFVGLAVGVGADLIGCLLAGYAINPIITLGAGCIGFFSGFAAMFFFKKNSLANLACSVGAAHIIGSMIVKSLGLHIYYGTPFNVLILRVPLYICIGTVECILIYTLLKNKVFSSSIERMCKRS